jgi:hypothetical protein
MAGRGLSIGVILEPIPEEGPFVHQSTEPSGELRVPALEVLGAQLVDRHEDDEGGLGAIPIDATWRLCIEGGEGPDEQDG